MSMSANVAESASNKVNGLELDGRNLGVNKVQPKGFKCRGQVGGDLCGGGGYGGGWMRRQRI